MKPPRLPKKRGPRPGSRANPLVVRPVCRLAEANCGHRWERSAPVMAVYALAHAVDGVWTAAIPVQLHTGAATCRAGHPLEVERKAIEIGGLCREGKLGQHGVGGGAAAG